MELEKEEIKKKCFELAEKWCRLNTADIPRQGGKYFKAIIFQMAQIENEIGELVKHRCDSWEIINYYRNCKYLKGRLTAEQWLDFNFFGIVHMNRYVLKRHFPVTFRNSYHKY